MAIHIRVFIRVEMRTAAFAFYEAVGDLREFDRTEERCHASDASSPSSVDRPFRTSDHEGFCTANDVPRAAH